MQFYWGYVILLGIFFGSAASHRVAVTYIIDFTMDSLVFTMIQHPGNTYIIDFTMNSVVFTML